MHQINRKIEEKNSIMDQGQKYEKKNNIILRLSQ